MTDEMILFDPKALDEPAGEYRVEVWNPTVERWMHMDGLVAGKWTFTRQSAAIDAAWRWVERGEILNPRCRIIDVGKDEAVWHSSFDMTGPARPVKVSERYL